jgi:TetR/AcrR family transcriptional regulator, cholesterol catabolism regulator
VTTAGPSAPAADGRQDRSGAATAARRAHIRRVAGDHFAEHGYHGASLRRVAEASGLKQGHLYYYFPSKQDLLFAVITGLQERFNAAMDDALARPDAPERVLPDLLAEHVRVLCTHAGDVTVSYESLRFLIPEHRAVLVAERDRYESGLRQLIDGCRAAIDIDPAPTAVLAKVVLGIVNWPYQWYRPTGALPVAALAGLLAARAMAALRVAPGGTHIDRPPSTGSTVPVT